MEAPRPSFGDRLIVYLAVLEKGLLAALVAGFALRYANLPGQTLISMSMSGLAIVFFLSAFRPLVGMDRPEGELMGFIDMLMFTIVPKVLGIASAVSVIGILFYLQDMKGYLQMILIGGVTIAAGTLILGYGIATAVKNANKLFPMLIRAVPLAILDAYIYWQQA
jgi:hypothetical protein